jgi:hypothetical protein
MAPGLLREVRPMGADSGAMEEGCQQKVKKNPDHRTVGF